VGTPGTILGDLEAQTKPYTTGIAGAQLVDPSKALGPYISRLQSVLKAPTAGAERYVGNMLREAEPALREMSPVMNHVFDPQNNFSPTAKVNMIESWMNNASRQQAQYAPTTNNLTVARAHAAKRAMYDLISDSAYKDVSGSVLPGDVSANQTLARGFKDAVNDVHPEMSDINNHMHNIITLKSAMNQAAKVNPKSFDQLMKSALGSMELAGGGALASSLIGYHGALPLSTGAAAGMALSKVLQSPRMATQLGILMGDTFPRLTDALQPFTRGPAAQAVLPAARSLNLQAGDQPMKDLGNQLIQQLLNAKPKP